MGGHYMCIILSVCLLPGGSEWVVTEPLQHRPQVLFYQQRREPHCLQLLQRQVSPPVSPPVHWEKEAFYKRLKDRDDVARSGTGLHSGWERYCTQGGTVLHSGWDGTAFRVGTVLHSGWNGTTFRVGKVLHSGWERYYIQGGNRTTFRVGTVLHSG